MSHLKRFLYTRTGKDEHRSQIFKSAKKMGVKFYDVFPPIEWF